MVAISWNSCLVHASFSNESTFLEMKCFSPIEFRRLKLPVSVYKFDLDRHTRQLLASMVAEKIWPILIHMYVVGPNKTGPVTGE